MKRALACCLGTWGLLFGCGGDSAELPLPPQDQAFIALARDFRGYQDWTSFDIPGDGVGSHTTGPRTIYLNHVPESGRTEFAVGTILVKIIHTEEHLPQSIFAMAKRGDDYNIRGALGWEWFELDEDPEEPTLLWRGVTAPGDGAYGGIAQGTCNGCHVLFIENDSVGGAMLDLDDF